jgi:uncharacterized protein
MTSAILRFTRKRPLLSYFVLAFAVSWTLWTPLIIVGEALNPLPGLGLLFLGVLGPTVAAFAVAWATGGPVGVLRLLRKAFIWRVHAGWYAVAVLAPVALMLAAVGLNALLGGPAPEVSRLAGLYMLAPVFVAFFFFFGPLEQEFGWRGLALPMLQARHSALFSALVTGALWGVWHLPLFWTPRAPQYSSIQGNSMAVGVIVTAVLYDTSLTVLFAWLCNSTRGSVLMALLFHASIDTALLVPMMLGLTGGSLAGNSQIFLLFLGLVLVWVAGVVVATGPRRLTRSPSPPEPPSPRVAALLRAEPAGRR